MTSTRRLIPYAGKERDSDPALNRHRIPVSLALQLRSNGLSWRDVRDEINLRTGRRFVTDSIVGACYRSQKC